MHAGPAHLVLSPTPGRLWASLLAGPVAWSASGLLGWFISAQACADGAPDWGPLDGAGVRIAVVLVGLSACAVSSWGLWAAARAWRASAHEPGIEHVQGRTTVTFLAAAGVLVSAAFIFGIALQILSPFMVGVCEFTR